MSTSARKPCKDCGKVKTLRQFYRHPSYADGVMNTCKLCHRAQVTANIELKSEYYRIQHQEIAARPKHRARRAAYQKSERGREVHRAACNRYLRFKRLEART